MAGGKFAPLIRPFLAVDAAGKRQITAYPFDVFCAPGPDLREMPDSESVQPSLVLRTDAADPLEVVRLTAERRRQAVGSPARMPGLVFDRAGLLGQALGECLGRGRIERRVGGIIDNDGPGFDSGRMVGVATGGKQFGLGYPV